MKNSISVMSVISAATGFIYIISSVLLGFILIALYVEGDFNTAKIIPAAMLRNLIPAVITFAVKIAAKSFLRRKKK